MLNWREPGSMKLNPHQKALTLPPRRRVTGGGAANASAVEAKIYRAASIVGFDDFQGDDEDCGATLALTSVFQCK